MRQNQRDRLRVFVLNERQKVFALRLLQERKRRGLNLLDHLLDDLGGHVVIHGLADQGLGVFQAAFVQIGIGNGKVVELPEDFLADGDGDFTEAGDFAADFLDRFGRQALENLRRLLLRERQQQHRGFANAA